MITTQPPLELEGLLNTMNEDLYRTDLPRTAKKIACIIPKCISTAIFATPTLQAIRQRYPTADITLITDRETLPLFKHWPEFSQIITIHNNGFWASLKTYIKIAIEPFDLLIDLYTPHHHIRLINESKYTPEQKLHNITCIRQHLLLGILAHATTSIGFTIDPADYGNVLLSWIKQYYRFSINIPTPKANVLMNENLANLTLGLIIDQRKTSIAAPIFNQEIRYESDYKALDIIKRYAKSEQSIHYIGLFFGGRHRSQHWPLNHAVEFAKKLTSSLQVQLHIFGSIIESEYTQSINEQLSIEIQEGLVVNHIQEFTLLESMALISECSIMVSTLGGPLAIADTLNIPLITLATSSVYYKNKSARQSKQILLNIPVNCSPCFLENCNQPISCQEQMTPSQVLEAVHAMIADRLSQVYH